MNKNIKYLIEDIVKFNPVDYSDEEQDIINNQTIDSMCICPKTLNELKEIIAKRLQENPINPYLLDINTSEITDMSGIFYKINTPITHYDIGQNEYFDKYGVSPATIKILNLSTWDTSKVKNMCGTFCGCRSLKKINLSKWNTSKVKDMSFLFYGCSFKNLDLSNFDTSNVLNMRFMFYGCESLKKLNLSNFDTSNVYDMSCMFEGCMSLVDLDLSYFNTINLTKCLSMFNYCLNLKLLDLSNFDTSNVENMNNMFSYCTNLEKIILSNKWSTYKVKSANEMFAGCESLTDIDFSNFYIDNIMHLYYDGCRLSFGRSKMFNECNPALIRKFKKEFRRP